LPEYPPACWWDEWLEQQVPLSGSFVIFDLRRDFVALAYLLLWFATCFMVPQALRRVNEPLGSRNAAYTPQEAADLARQSQLTGWQVTPGFIWLLLEGRKRSDEVNRSEV
jgi:hypothetical protein